MLDFNFNDTINAVNDKLTTLLSTELTSVKNKVSNVHNKEKGKIIYLPVDDCKSLLLSYGKDLAREILDPIYAKFKSEVEKRETLETRVADLETELNKTKKDLIETKIENDKANQFGRREMIRLHNI